MTTMREEFEAWWLATEIVPSLEKDGFGDYFFSSVEFAWRSWQASARVERKACAELRGEMSPLDAMQDEDVGSSAMVRVADRAYDLYEEAIRKRGEAK